MADGYTRQAAANIVDGQIINASDHNAEYNAIQAAFHATTGHNHDGTAAGGANIVTNSITDSAVTTTKVADSAITTAKITDASVTTSKMADNSVTNIKMADMAVNTIKGRITTGTGDPEDLTAAQVQTIIGAGSGNGLDADTVDGVHASSFAQLSGATFTGSVNLPTMNSTTTNAANITISHAAPYLDFSETDAGTDSKYWRMFVDGSTMLFRLFNDARNSTNDIFYFARSGLSNVYAMFVCAVRGYVFPLTDATTITPDMQKANYFSVTLGGNRTLANPTNLAAGQGGSITIRQDGTGSRTLSFGSYWKFPGGTVPTLTATASAVDKLTYEVVSATEIHANLIKDFK